jgi:Family of unknown function (DUF6152)
VSPHLPSEKHSHVRKLADCSGRVKKRGSRKRPAWRRQHGLTARSACYRFRLVRRTVALPAALVAVALAIPAMAHHSFSAEFDGGKLIELKGVVTRIEWANPHVYFYLDVKDEKGNTSNWGCEAASPGSLHRQGWNRDSLKVGDQVIVGGYPARDGSKLADARRVTLPDGRRIFSGTAGDGAPGEAKY